MIALKQILLSTVFYVLLTLNSCPEPDSNLCIQKSCITTDFDNNRSINGFDLNASSAFENQVVANFKFIQTTTDYSPPNECSTCPATSYSVKLQITNETNKIIHFDYSISFLLNFVSWNYQSVVTINPNATIDVGQISNNGASITLGQFTIQSSNITYQ